MDNQSELERYKSLVKYAQAMLTLGHNAEAARALRHLMDGGKIDEEFRRGIIE